MTVRQHRDAFKARLQVHPDLAAITFEGIVPKGPTKYVTVHAATPSHSQSAFTGPLAQEDYTFTTHSVGTTADQALWVADRVQAQLVGHVLIVPGRVCRRLRHPVGRPVEEDDDVTPSLFYVADQWDFTSDPAPTP